MAAGRYDALMSYQDKSVIYAWLIERFSGIVPSVKIIYLDEKNRTTDIFSPAGKDISISRNELLAFLEVSRDSFRVYPSKSGSDVMIGIVSKT